MYRALRLPPQRHTLRICRTGAPSARPHGQPEETTAVPPTEDLARVTQTGSENEFSGF